MPEAGETVYMAAAIGPVGAMVGQIAKLMGCPVVGIAGGAEKCAYAVASLRFDACIDYKASDFPALLKAAAAGGHRRLFRECRRSGVRCGVAASEHGSAGAAVRSGVAVQRDEFACRAGPDRLSWLMGQMLRKRLTVRGFVIFQDFGHLYPEFARAMGAWLAAGKVRYVEDMIEGLEEAPQAFIGLLRGENFGKRGIHVGPTKTIENKELHK